MAMEFGKLNFAVGFNRTSAFPLDANSYFENYDNAVTAAAGAAEVGSADSAYYVGQLIIVKDTTKGVGLYQIGADKKLVKFGQASSADELTADLAALKGRFNNIVRDLPVTEGEDGAFTLLEPSESIPLGFFKNEEKTKLAGIEAGAQVNKIESVKVNGTALDITEKAVDIDLSAYAKTVDMNKKVASVAAGDKSVTVGGTATAPTVKVAIASGEDNALTLAADGLKVVVPAAAEYSMKKLDAANEGMSASYQLTKNGTGVGAVIDIPKDMVVKSGTVETYKEGNLPTGVTIAGTYIVLTLANATEDTLYINVDGLIEYVTGGSGEDDAIQINVTSDTHKVTASVKNGSLTLAMMDAGVKASLAKADSAVQEITTGTTNGTINVDGDEVAVAGLKDAAYATVESLNATAQDKADAVKTALIGKEADTKAEDTIKGAKKYADDAVSTKVGTLKYEDAAVAKQFVIDVSETNGIISVNRRALTAEDVPVIEIAGVNGLQGALNGKQDTVTFNTAYDAATNKAATMTDINNAKTALVGVASGETPDTKDSNTIEGAKRYADDKAGAAEKAAKAYADSIVSGDSGIVKKVEELEKKHADGKTVAEEVTAGIEALDLPNTYAAKDITEAHIADKDIHVTAAKKTAWDGAVTDVTTLKGEESVAGSVKAIAKSYADGKDAAIAAAKKAGDDAAEALDTYKTSNDARVKAIEDKEATWDGKQDAITDGSAVIATAANDVVTIKAGVAQKNGAVAQGTGADITLAKVAKTGKAVDIAVADTAEKFTATDLEAVLAELADSIQVNGTSSKVTCEKSTPEGVAARYVFKQGGVAIENATIDIPKDMVVKEGSVVENPAGQPAGTYLKLVLANADEDTIYINVNGLIEYVTSGSTTSDSVQIAVSDDHKVTATIKDGSIALGKLATAVQTQINKAHEHANKTVLDGITAEQVAKWDATDTAIGEAVEAGVAELDFTDTAVAGQYVDKVDQENGVIKPHRVALPTATAAALGLVKVDDTTIAVNAGVISVKAVSTDLLTQGTNELVLNGGTSVE